MNTIKLLIRYMKKNKYLFFFTILMVIFLNYIRSIIPKLTSEFIAIIDPVTSSSTLPNYLKSLYGYVDTIKDKLLLTAIIICVIALIRETINIFCDVNVYKISEYAGCKAQQDYFNKVQDLPYSYLNHAQIGDLIQRSTQDINRFKTFIVGSLLELFNSICKVVIFGICMLFINVKFSLCVFIMLPVYFIFSYIYFKSQSKDFNLIEQEEGKVTNVLQENLTSIRVVKAFANENYEINKFNKAFDKYVNVYRKINFKMARFWGFSDFLTYIQLILVFILTILFINNGLMSFSEAVVMFLYTEYIIWPCKSLGRQLAEFGKTSICCGRILEVLDLKDEYENDGKLTPEIKGNIEFKNVSFSFPDSSIPTIKNINLKINAGETIAIVGKTGSGKSTLVNMLNRLVDPTEGKLLIDGVDSKNIKKKYLREKVGIVLQEPFLYSKSIQDNINIASSNSSLNKARQLAFIASVDEDIEHFKLKYDTLVGERGVTLSGGQKQRIAIARVLSKQSPILVFDDSLSAVDTETDLKIRKKLKEKEKQSTTIIITHRITTAKDADKIIVIEDGMISNVGTHEQLIKIPGLYQTIWKIQNYFVDNSKEA